MYFYVVIIKSLSTVHKYAITVFIYSGTSMGHAQWGCGHTFDALQIFLLPPFFWGDCDKFWHGWAIVIVLKPRNEKNTQQAFLRAKFKIKEMAVRKWKKIRKKLRHRPSNVCHEFEQEIDWRLTSNFRGLLPGYTRFKESHQRKDLMESWIWKPRLYKLWQEWDTKKLLF